MDRSLRLYRVNLLIVLLLWVSCTLPLAQAQTIIQVKETNSPQNMVLLIIDGMGSHYVCPGHIPYALDGRSITPAQVPILDKIILEGVLIPSIHVPFPKTGRAHSVITTGYSEAEQEMVEYPYATIYDLLKDREFLSIAIMHKGDFTQLRSKQDIILCSESNSINEPSLNVQINGDHVPVDIINELEYWEQKLPAYLEGTGGMERYFAYTDWELDALEDIISMMAKQHPETTYILTVNVGVVDSAGHYRGVDGYIDTIEALDNNLEQVYEAAQSSNTAFIITADHGMAFTTSNASRGGHASDEYYSNEAVTVPLIMVSPNLIPSVIHEKFQQEDIAATLLSIFDIPERPKYSDGVAIQVKDYVTLAVSSDMLADVEIFQGTHKIAGGTGDNEYIFNGLKSKISYTIRLIYKEEIEEQTVFLNEDCMVRFDTAACKEKQGNNYLWRKRIAFVLIVLVIIAGLLVISRIQD